MILLCGKQVRQLFDVVDFLKIDSDTDLYFVSSVIRLLDLSVGNETLPAAERVMKLNSFIAIRYLCMSVFPYPVQFSSEYQHKIVQITVMM